MSRTSSWSQLRRRDRCLIALLLPLWVATLLLHIDMAAENSLRRPAILLSSATAGGYPTVAHIAGGAEQLVAQAGLQLGDELLSIAGRDMRDRAGFSAGVASFAAISGDTSPASTFRRDEVLFEVEYPFMDFGIPWWWPTLFGLSFGVVGFLILWRAPRSEVAQALFPGFLTFALTWQIFPGHSELLVWISAIVYAGSMFFAGPLLLRAIMLLPERTAIRSRWLLLLPWVFALMSISGPSLFFGYPLSPERAQALHFSLVSLFYLAILSVLARNYYRADKLGRRQLRWILLGFYFAFVPAMLVTAVIAVFPDRLNLYALSSLGMPTIPIMFLIAIAQYNLFDIDKLIGGSVSYTLLLILVAVCAEAFIEPLVAYLGTRFGYDGDSTQLVFVAALTAALIPAQRRWRPMVDRVFFAEGLAVEDAIESLIEKLEGNDSADSVERIRLLGVELASIYQFENWAVFTSATDGEDSQPLIEGRGGISMDSAIWGKYLKRVRPGTETLADGQLYLVAPIRPEGSLEWLLVLGPKKTGDVYTTSDRGLIASVTHIVAMEISEHEVQS